MHTPFGTREITTNWQNYVEQSSKRFQIVKSSKVWSKGSKFFETYMAPHKLSYTTAT